MCPICVIGGVLLILWAYCAIMTEEMTEISSKQAARCRPLAFRKRERLRHRNAVTRLFEEGKSEYAYPLRMFWLVLGRDQMESMFHGSVPRDVDRLQMMVTVPKKKFKHAVDRVWLRRRIREAYRLNRLPLRDKVCGPDAGGAATDRFLQLAFIYVGAEKREYASVEKKMVKLLDKAAALLEGKDDKAGKEVAATSGPEHTDGYDKA